MNHPLRIFLCYASQDKPVVGELYAALRSEAWLDPWLDKANILPGQDWRLVIEQAVEDADVVILCLSNQSVTKDGYVHKEIRYAYDIALEKPEGTIFLIPLRLDDCKVPRVVSHLQWVDYFGADRKQAFFGLLESLRFRYSEQDKIDGKKPYKNTFKAVGNTDKTAVPSMRWVWLSAFILAFAAFAVFGLRNIFKPISAGSTPTSQTETPALTESPQQPTAASIDTPMPVESAPVLDVGSSMVSEKDRMKLVYVPAGKFLMGSDNGHVDEKPLREVQLDAFWIDQTEVTNDMYLLCVRDGVCEKPNDVSHYINAVYSDHPVVYVTWENANSYCSWAGRRLPSEAEWEKAARGTDGNLYPWGNELPDKGLLNFDNNPGDTTRAGKYANGESMYGALDMAGNVWEWVNDWYEETYYLHSPSTNPAGPDSGTTKVLRGGTWISDANFVQSSHRVKAGPMLANFYIGFRCAVSP